MDRLVATDIGPRGQNKHLADLQELSAGVDKAHKDYCSSQSPDPLGSQLEVNL